MKEDLISVVVPVYNVEKYLDKCVLSILNQSYQNLEIILVDDGSPDNCGVICDKYRQQDKRIRVIHKKNGGLSDARNAGIEIATGKYITFVDSDDYIDEDYIEYLYSLIKKYKVNLSFCKYCVERSEPRNRENSLLKDEKCDKISAFEEILYARNFEVSACAKMYLRSQFKGIRFPVGKLFEDNATIYKLIEQNDYIALGYKSKYNYVIRKDSITTKTFTPSQMYLITASDEMCDYLKKYSALQKAIKRKKGVARISTLNRMIDSSTRNDAEEKKLKKDILQYKSILYDNKASLRDRVSILLLTFGLPVYKICWYIYKKMTERV